MPKPTAAQAIYGHLVSGVRAESSQRTPNISDAMWPGLSREAKGREADQQLWAKILKQQRDNLVRGLREANGRER
jgi:hypothetical protein